jgi:hypothetical protein
MTCARAEAIMLKQSGCMRGRRPDPLPPVAGHLVMTANDGALRGVFFLGWRPRQGSTLHPQLRRLVLYPVERRDQKQVQRSAQLSR